ncbi:30S ribosomal protein S17 [Candidatus Woesearchaeota archaeon]|nr:30S ribosomal protein S17 [Candidatus Woesearchaeota archaeon]
MKQNVFGIKAPVKSDQYDKKCPFYGEINVKKEFLTGVVIKKDTNRSATIEWHNSISVPKYERFTTKRSRIRVHNPASINAQVGDQVRVARTRPLSKTKHHVIIQVLRHGSVAASTLAQQEQQQQVKELKEKQKKAEKVVKKDRKE